MLTNLLNSINEQKTILIVTIFLAFVLGLIIGMLKSQIGFSKKLKDERNDAVKRSKAVLSGQMAEQVAPFLPDFPCNPADVRFVGKPVDFIAFPGAAEDKPVREVVLIEVKTGGSKLSEREKQIKDAVEHGRVRYVEYYFDPEA